MDDIQELVQNEKIETTIPIGYCLCFLMAYYGPNSTVLGLEDIDEADVVKMMKITALFFSIDLCSLIVSSILLWKFCRFNLFNAYLHSQKELWSIMASQEAILLFQVSYVNIHQ